MKYLYIGLVSIVFMGQLNASQPQEDGFANGQWTGTFHTANGIIVQHTPDTNALKKDGFAEVKFRDMPFSPELDIKGSSPEGHGVLKLVSSIEDYRREVSKIASIIKEEDVYAGIKPVVLDDGRGSVVIANHIINVPTNSSTKKVVNFSF